MLGTICKVQFNTKHMLRIIRFAMNISYYTAKAYLVYELH